MRPDQEGYQLVADCGCVLTIIKHDKIRERTVVEMDWRKCKAKQAVKADPVDGHAKAGVSA